MTGYARIIRRLLVPLALASLALPAAARAAQPSAATRALERSLGPQAVVDIDSDTGTARVVARLDGTLTGPSTDAPATVAMDYVQDHLAALGLTAADLETLGSPTTATASGVTEVRWRQTLDGIPTADSELRVNLTADGSVLNVLGSPAHDLDADTTPALDAGEAVRAVQDAVGVFRSLPRDRGPAGATQATTYADGSTAKLRLHNGRLTWRVMYRAASDAVYDAFVDAETGRVLKRANMVKFAAPIHVWENFPGATVGGTAVARDLETPGYLAPGATTLNGPNVHAFADVNDNDALDGGEAIPRTAGGFDFAFTPRTTGTGGCSASRPCSWNSLVPNSWNTSLNRNQSAVQAFYFANSFHNYLALAPISFTTGAFEGADELVLHTNDGAAGTTTPGLPDGNHRNNANMFTPPDGSSPLMQMYLWGGGAFRDVNGGDDASVLYHEYTHGLSNRLVKDADGAGALNSAQAGAMGEGWSDWYAKDFLVDQIGVTDTAAAGEIAMGTYTDAVPNSIRTQPLDCPVGASAAVCPGTGTAGSGGYTYGDFGNVANDPEVHRDGEIWAETLWDLRRSAVGGANARRLITQAMRLSPPEPSFLDMRNAILQADQAAGGTFRAEIWSVFAARGMGFFAASVDGADESPVPDNSTPPAGPFGRIAGRVTDVTTGAAIVGAKAAIGGLANGPDARVGTSGGDGGYAIENVPAHAYPSFVFNAPGYDRLVRPITVAAGLTASADATLRRNWASASGGTTAFGDDKYGTLGCGTAAALDQNPGTGWSTDDVGGTNSMILTLPQAVDVERFGINPKEACGDSVNSSTSDIRIETSTTSTGGPWTIAASPSLPFNLGTMTEVTPAAGAASVRHVRVTLLDSWGGPFRDLTEFAVYGRPVATATPTPTATPLPTVSPTPTPTPVPTIEPPKFVLPTSGKKSTLKFKVTCRAACTVSARLDVSAVTAKRIGLGKKRVAGTLKARTLKAGTTNLTLTLTSKVKKTMKTKKLKSFRGTLKASAAYAGAPAVEKSKLLTIKR